MGISGLRPHVDSLLPVDNYGDNLWIFSERIFRERKTNVLIHIFLKVIHSLSTVYPQGKMIVGLHIIYSMVQAYLLNFKVVDTCFDKKNTKSVNTENELSTG